MYKNNTTTKMQNVVSASIQSKQVYYALIDY